MNYSLKELLAELEDQKYELTPGGGWVIDFNDVIRALGHLEKELREVLYFHTAGNSEEKCHAYGVLKGILGE